MKLKRERAASYRELLFSGFTRIRHNLPSIRGNEAASRDHHARARVIADRMHRLAAASVQDFRDFDEADFWTVKEGIDATDGYLQAFCDRGGFETNVARRVAGPVKNGTPAMSPSRMAAYRKIIQAAYGAIRGLLETDDATHVDSFRRRAAVEIADRMHNLAHFSAVDFAGFEEDRFWSEGPLDAPGIYPFIPDFNRSTFERDLGQPDQRD